MPLKEIFCYITWRCNLACRHCYVGQYVPRPVDIGLALFQKILQDKKKDGAENIHLLGGDPVLHPGYEDIVKAAADLAFSRITIDTNGTAGFPVPGSIRHVPGLFIRFGFDGHTPELHDAVRGSGIFSRAIQTLRQVQERGVRTEVTLTLNAHNIDYIEDMVFLFEKEHVCEINFHFLSSAGSACGSADMILRPGKVIEAQAVLSAIRSRVSVPLRFPLLLVPKDQIGCEISRGLSCRRITRQVELILPDGSLHHCPLHMSAVHPAGDPCGSGVFEGCTRPERIFPAGIPDTLAMTCISWKPMHTCVSNQQI